MFIQAMPPYLNCRIWITLDFILFPNKKARLGKLIIRDYPRRAR